MQRRSSTKESDPNMLDISCAGHLSAGEDSLNGAIRELKEELNLDIRIEELKFIKTIISSEYKSTFINNEFDDLYIMITDKNISDMKYQQDEISEIFFVSYKEFKEMIINKQADLLMYPEEFEVIFNMFDEKYNK